MDTSALENIGLTKNEISIYVSLLELGSVRAGAIVDKSGLQNSVVHLGLKKLIQKGFVSFVKEGKVRRFHACDPDNILRYIDEKRKSCEDLIPALIAKQEHQERQDAEIFEGINGFKNMLYQFMEGGKKGDQR